MNFKYCDLGQPEKRLKGEPLTWLSELRPEDMALRQAKLWRSGVAPGEALTPWSCAEWRSEDIVLREVHQVPATICDCILIRDWCYER